MKLREKNRREIEFIAASIDEKLEEELQHLLNELESGYEKEDALFLLLSFFKKMKREAEKKFSGEQKKLMLKRLKKAFIFASFDFGIKKNELGRYLRELGIRESREEREEKKREELEKVRKAVTTDELRKRIKPVRKVSYVGSNIELEPRDALLALLLIALLIYIVLRLI